MRMGNYLFVWRLHHTVMSASTETLGIQHLTVVPTNFEPATESSQPAVDDDADTAER